LSNGDAFLSEHKFGEGRVLFFSVPPSLAWSDFPLKGVFAPLMYRSVIYTSARNETGRSFIVGDEPVIGLSNSSGVDFEKPYTLLTPDATEERIRPNRQASASLAIGEPFSFEMKQLTLPGIYEVKNGTNALALFEANIDTRESDCTKATASELEDFWKHLGIHQAVVRTIGPDEQIQAAIVESRFGVELWKYCIGIALLLSLVEMLVARDSRKMSEPSS